MERWQKAAVELFSEVTILEPLIRSRVEAVRPEGLNETGLTILMILARQEGVTMTRSALLWMLGDDHPEASVDLDNAISNRLVDAHAAVDLSEWQLQLTDAGKSKCGRAIQSLLPQFEPAFVDISVEALEQSMNTLREIRRTLDNLPD